MSNYNYHTGYMPWSKQQKRAFFIKLWLKRISLVLVVVISLAVLFYQTFISNLIPEIKPRYTRPLVSMPNKDISASTLNVQNEVADDLDQVTLKETTLKKENGKKNSEEKLPETLTNNVLMTSVLDDSPALKSYLSNDSIDSISVDPDKNKAVQKAENEINYKAKEEQNIQVAYITKQISTNKVMTPNSVTNSRISTTKNIETVTIETKPEAILTSNQSIIELTQPTESKLQNIDDIKDIQAIYQENLDRLSNEAELEDLFKNNNSKFSKLIEL